MTSESARLLLESLGDTPEKVAQSLKDRGIRGVRYSLHRCPIARLLQGNGYPRAWVGTRGAHCESGNGDWSFNLPPPVATVRRIFDAGLLPELEER